MEPLLDALTPVVSGRQRVVACHSATLSGRFPPNSLAAVAECVARSVPRIEVDVRFLADDSMAIFHDDRLDRDSTGTGSLAALTRTDLVGVRYRSDEQHGVCFLEDVVDCVKGSRTMLQVDLKLMRPISKERSTRLIGALSSVREQLIVGSQAHWNLRRLTELPVAFDPTLQFHRSPERRAGLIPASLGVHGLWDDAAYAGNPHFSALEYIEARLEDAWRLVPEAREWMVDIETVGHLATLGIDPGMWLGARGCELAAWTFRENTVDRQRTVAEMLALGVTTFITDCPLRVAEDIEMAGSAL